MSNVKVKISTNKGDLIASLNSEKAPKTVENFLAYVKSNHFSDTIFHRVIDGFMIQGGGFDKDMNQKDTLANIKNEANNGLKNTYGTLAMARTSEPHSASSQFFINIADNDFLNFRSETPEGWGYAVFGEVIEGKEVLEAIRTVKTGNNGFHQDVPVEPVIIQSAELVTETAAS